VRAERTVAAETRAASEHRAAPRWAAPITLVLSLLGLGVSIYLTIEHYTGNTGLACPESSTVNCAKVTTSPESIVAGIPVAVLGLPFFVAMIAASLPPAWRLDAAWLRLARVVAVGVGMVFVLYLVYVELFRVSAICLWCTSVHLITFLLLVTILLAEAFRET
jgi:uncharacterized membrane protein